MENGYLFNIDDAIRDYNIKEKDISVVRAFNKELEKIHTKYFELALLFKDQEVKDDFLYQLNILSGVYYSTGCTVKLFDMTVHPKDYPEKYRLMQTPLL